MFWESTEYQDIPLETDDSLLSFSNLSENSEALSWPDTPLFSGCSGSSWGTHASNVDIPLPAYSFGEDLRTARPGQRGDSRTLIPPLLAEEESQVMATPPLVEDQQVPYLGVHRALSVDDPFMGWGMKKTSQMSEDYGWVLSHVETL